MFVHLLYLTHDDLNKKRVAVIPPQLPLHYLNYINTLQTFSTVLQRLVSPEANTSSKEATPFTIPKIAVNPFSYNTSTPSPTRPAKAITGISYRFATEATPKGVFPYRV
jgi:hypothetical protein